MSDKRSLGNNCHRSLLDLFNDIRSTNEPVKAEPKTTATKKHDLAGKMPREKKTALAMSAPRMAEEEWAALFRNNLLRSCWKPGLTSDEVQHVLTLWERKLVEVRPRAEEPAEPSASPKPAPPCASARMSCVDPTQPSLHARPPPPSLTPPPSLSW